MIPVFVGSLLYYRDSELPGGPDERFRLLAIGVFILASVSDALDGWIARRFQQRSALGAILDPLADKGLLLSAIISLSWLELEGLYRLPIWFLVLVLSRDILLVAGIATFHFYGHEVKVLPHWLGKASTFLMMVSIASILLKLDEGVSQVLVRICGVFTFGSLMVYLVRGIQLLSHLHDQPPPEGGRL